MQTHRIVAAGAAFVFGLGLAGTALAQDSAVYTSGPGPLEAEINTWTGGASTGILFNTPDDAAFGFNAHGDYILSENTSFGPLLQVGLTDDLTQIAASGQGKYWLTAPGSEGRGRVNLQGGMGIVRADLNSGDDTAVIFPVGVGYDYTFQGGATMTTTGLLNITNLRLAGDDRNLMSSLMVGFHFYPLQLLELR